MKYFITGATGFLGGVIARQLREANQDVIAVVRNPDKAEALRSTGVVVIKGDVTDKESMRDAMRGCDGVFHVAGWYKIGAREKSQGRKINVEGTRNVLELMKELSIPKGVYTSTLAVNSHTHGVLQNEDYHFTGKHISEYDKTKAQAHNIAQQFMQEGLPLVIVMPGMIYGPDGTSMSDEAWRLYIRKKLPMVGAGTAYCWGHVEDIARAHLLAMEKAAPRSTYMICGPPHSFNEAFDIAEKITGIRKPIQVPPALMRISAFIVSLFEWLIPIPEMYSSETMRVSAGTTYLGDNSKAKRELGYNPRPLETGLKQTLEYEMEKIKNARRV